MSTRTSLWPFDSVSDGMGAREAVLYELDKNSEGIKRGVVRVEDRVAR